MFIICGFIILLSCSQIERYDREHLARKQSLELNVKDIFDRQQIAGDPGVRQHDRQVSKIRPLNIENVYTKLI